MKIEVVPPKEAIEASPAFVNNVRIVGDPTIGALVVYFSYVPADVIQLSAMAGFKPDDTDPDEVFRLELPPVAKLALSSQAIAGVLEALTIAFSNLQKGVEIASAHQGPG